MVAVAIPVICIPSGNRSLSIVPDTNSSALSKVSNEPMPTKLEAVTIPVAITFPSELIPTPGANPATDVSVFPPI